MIKWLCTLPLLKELYRQGGIDSFALAQKDILETMRDDLEEKAEELAKEKLNTLLSVVDEKMIISFSDREKAVYIGSEKITDPSQLQSLKIEAEMFLSSRLWKIIYETPKELAHRAMFVAGESIDDMKKGRSILYTLETQKRILDTLRSYTQQAPRNSVVY